MKKIFILCLFMALSFSCFAQDVIVKHDGTTILTKVLEIKTSEIVYKKWDNLEGPSYTIQQSEVMSINYQNGTKDSFTPSKSNGDFLQNEKKTSWFIGLTPSLYFKGSVVYGGLHLGFLKKIDENLRWGIATGVETAVDDLKITIPLYGRFEYESTRKNKKSFFASVDAGAKFYNFEALLRGNDDEYTGAVRINPAAGCYFKNFRIGLGLMIDIPVEGEGDPMTGINLNMALRFGNKKKH